MPRYFFNIYHDRVTRYDLGTELPDKHATWEEATTAAGEIIRGIDGSLKPDRDWRLEVSDEFANPLWEIHVKALPKSTGSIDN